MAGLIKINTVKATGFFTLYKFGIYGGGIAPNPVMVYHKNS